MDRIMKESDMRSMTTNENYRALLALTEDFECVSLRDDLGNFERERMLSIGYHVMCLSSAESDSRYVHEDVHCRDADGCLEYLESCNGSLITVQVHLQVGLERL